MPPRINDVQDLADEVDEVAVDAQPAGGEFAVDDHPEGQAAMLPGFGEGEPDGVRRPLRLCENPRAEALTDSTGN